MNYQSDEEDCVHQVFQQIDPIDHLDTLEICEAL